MVGAGGHAVSVTETVVASGFEVTAYTSAGGSTGSLLGKPVLSSIPRSHVEAGGRIVIAIGDNFSRQRAWQELTEWIPPEQFPTFAHPSATISRQAELSVGTVILQGAIVGAGARISEGCIVNSGACLEHESHLGRFCSLAPRAVIGGRVRIGSRSAVSIGATIKHGVTVGSDTVVGAASYVHADLPSLVVAYGSPARVVRHRNPGDPYLH